jgi:hypothetical protein
VKGFRIVIALIFLSFSISLPVNAHHSFAMFDDQSEMWLDGTVTLFQWTNPHTFIHVLVETKNKNGEILEQVEWSLEGGSPNILSRNGWKRTSLIEGEKVRVLIYPLKDGNAGGTFLEIHKEDGTVLYYHG